jgi:hypothetical protein
MNKELIDDCFYIKYKKYGTWCSYDKEDKSLVTSLTEEQCVIIHTLVFAISSGK